ncbi:unnamed protein product [Boreogadus saida]
MMVGDPTGQTAPSVTGVSIVTKGRGQGARETYGVPWNVGGSTEGGGAKSNGKLNFSLSCDVCRASLVTDAVAVPFDQSYHLLELRNNGGLMIPSKVTVKVVRAAERAIRQHSPGKAPDERGNSRKKLGKTILFQGF